MSLDPQSIQSAINEIKARQKWFENKLDEFARRVAEKGCSIATANYRSNDGTVVVSVEPYGKGYVIRASGEDVCFLEFGAGVSTNSGHPYADKMPFEVRPGSWSEEHAQHYSKHKYWYYDKKKYYGITPTMAMYRTQWQLQYDVYQIAREVFK